MTDPEDTLPPTRRKDDPRIEKLVIDVEAAMAAQKRMQATIDETKTSLDANTLLTAEMKGTVDDVKNIVTSMKTLLTVSKWIGSMAVAIGSVVVAFRQIKGGG
jgi:hypothetical protein